MEKVILERFISKYNLGGSAEAVLWVKKDDELKTRFISDDKNVLGVVTLDGFKELDDSNIPIPDTTQLKSLLGVLESDIKLSFGKTGTRASSIQIKDGSTKVAFMLADEKIIPEVPNLKQLPPFEIEISVDKKFSNTFVKAKNAMGDSADTFTIISTGGKKAQVVLGHSSINSNRVTLEALAPVNDTIDAISFSAKYLREVLLANKECESGIMKIASKGLCYVTFEDTDGFSSDYYLFQVQKA